MIKIIDDIEFELIKVDTDDCDGCYFDGKCICPGNYCVQHDENDYEIYFILHPKEL